MVVSPLDASVEGKELHDLVLQVVQIATQPPAIKVSLQPVKLEYCPRVLSYTELVHVRCMHPSSVPVLRKPLSSLAALHASCESVCKLAATNWLVHCIACSIVLPCLYLEIKH